MSHWTETTFEDKSEAFVHVLTNQFDEGQSEARDLLRTVKREAGFVPGRVLDVGCGIGRHAIPFAEQGCDVDGIDISTSYLSEARERAAAADVSDRTAFHEYDMRDLLDWDRSYDLVTVFFDTLGYYGKETDRQILQGMVDCLGEDGALVAELSNKDAAITAMWDAQAQQMGDVYRLQRLDYDIETSRLTSTIDLFAIQPTGYEYIDRVILDLHLYSPTEFRELCLDAGFESVELFGDFGGNPVSMRDSTFVALASV